MKPGQFLFSIIFLAVAHGYLLAATPRKHFLYLLVILLLSGYVTGSFFKVLHLKGADELLITGLIGDVAGAALFIRSGIRNETGKILLHQLLLGIVIAGQVVSANFFLEELTFARIANYLIVALTTTMLIRGNFIHRGEKNLLTLFLFVGIVAVAVDFLRLF